MFNIFLSLLSSIVILMIVINSIFSNVDFEKDKNFEINNFIVNIIHLVVMLIVTSLVCLFFLKNIIDNLTLTFIILLICGKILFIWMVYKTNILDEYIGKVEYNYNDLDNLNNDSNNSNNSNNDSNNDSTKQVNITGPAFSRYHDKNDRDFSFESSYPNYNKIKPSMEPAPTSNVSGVPDYSMYNGYDPSHICYRCGCITRENGYTFCGKEIPGMGTIGCSSRWGCKNCKDCEEPSNTAPVSNSNDYVCKSCRCLETNVGKICGRVSRVDGYVQRCSSECSTCDKCYGETNNGSGINNEDQDEKFITIDANSNLNRIVINNIQNSDLNDIIEN